MNIKEVVLPIKWLFLALWNVCQKTIKVTSWVVLAISAIVTVGYFSNRFIIHDALPENVFGAIAISWTIGVITLLAILLMLSIIGLIVIAVIAFGSALRGEYNSVKRSFERNNKGNES